MGMVERALGHRESTLRTVKERREERGRSKRREMCGRRRRTRY